MGHDYLHNNFGPFSIIIFGSSSAQANISDPGGSGYKNTDGSRSGFLVSTLLSFSTLYFDNALLNSNLRYEIPAPDLEPEPEPTARNEFQYGSGSSQKIRLQLYYIVVIKRQKCYSQQIRGQKL
jgi:hypothetical protein